jgi:simple sugar transport system ATP-binding protein
MQRVEIIRALLTEPKLLILDEPTSVLTPQAVEKLFVVLHKLVSQGVSILYISHKLHEIRALCSACTVLRGGKLTGVCDPREESNASLSRLMIGAEPPALQHVAREPGAEVLSVKGLSLSRQDPFGVDLDGIDLQVRAGEVVGLAGVSGNGQKELMWALSGEDTRAGKQCGAASVSLLGQPVAALGPVPRRQMGLHLCPRSACRKTCCSRAAKLWVRAAGCAWACWPTRPAASSTDSRSRPLARMPQRSRCRVAICKSSS